MILDDTLHDRVTICFLPTGSRKDDQYGPRYQEIHSRGTRDFSRCCLLGALDAGYTPCPLMPDFDTGPDGRTMPDPSSAQPAALGSPAAVSDPSIRGLYADYGRTLKDCLSRISLYT